MKDRDFTNKKGFKWFEIIISLVVSVVTALFGNHFGSTNFLADAFVGFMLPYVVFTPFQIKGKSVEITHELEDALLKLKETNKETYELYLTETKEITRSINESCSSLIYKCSYKPNMDLYKSVCSRLMSYFSGNAENDYFYATAECSKNSINWFFDEYNLAGEFLPLLNTKCQSKEITQFRRIFIYNKYDLDNPVLYFLAHLHNKIQIDHKDNYCDFDFKFISSTAYKNINRESHISDEMGVWGTHCVFIQKNDATPNGYCFDKDQIMLHKKAFDKLWRNKNCKHFKDLSIDIHNLVAHTNFENEILEIIHHIMNEDNTRSLTNKLDKELSLLDIGEIQSAITASYPSLSTKINKGTST